MVEKPVFFLKIVILKKKSLLTSGKYLLIFSVGSILALSGKLKLSTFRL